jgi:hypothetical protein
MGVGEPDYVGTLTRLSLQYPKRRRLRALLVQGAAAALTDPETRDQLRREQLRHLQTWIDGYERTREQQHIDPSVDMEAVVLYSWAAELGLGVLEAFGIAPRSRKSWADMANRFGRGLQLPPDRT